MNTRTMYCENVVTPRELISPATLEIADGSIVSVEAASSAPSGSTRIDGIVVPGLVDLQVNGLGPHVVGGGDAEGIEAISHALLAAGVTAWCPTIVTCPEEVRLASLDAIAATSDGGARILGAHLEGPWISTVRAGAHDADLIEPPEAAAIERTLSRHPGLVRIVTIAPEAPGGIDAIGQIAATGAIASLGHTDASFELARDAIDAGARMATHLFNAMRPLHHRQPGVIAAVLADERVVAGVIADGIHLHPATVALILRAKHHRAALVSDAVPGRRTDEDVVRRADGTMAGSLATLDAGLRTATGADVSLTDAVTAATRTPATLLGEGIGRIAPGAPADLAVLSDDLTPRATYLGGEPAWSA